MKLKRNLYTICFLAICFISCCFYNAYFTWEQAWTLRAICIGLGVVLLLGVRVGEFCNKFFFVFEGLVAIVGAVYVVTCCQGRENTIIGILSVVMCMVLGACLWIIGKQLVQSKGKWLDKRTLVIWLLSVLTLVVLQNGRNWTFMLLIPFTLLLLKNWQKEEKEALLSGIINGVILNGYVMVALGVLFRTYDIANGGRYYGMFHTPANFAFMLLVTYMALLAKYKDSLFCPKSVKWYKYVWIWLNIGVVLVLILLAASRNVYVSAVICTFIYFLLYFRKSIIKSMIKSCLMFLLSAVICFPLVYVGIRYVPAIVDRPYIFGNEWVKINEGSYDKILWNDGIDSWKYVTFEQAVNRVYMQTGVKKCVEVVTEFFDKLFVMEVNAQELNDEEMKRQEVLAGGLNRISNGRLFIYRHYLQHMNLTGHEGDNLPALAEYENLNHAHSNYVQVFYSFGIIGGVAYLLWMCYAARETFRKRKENLFAFLIVCAYITAGFFETGIHPCGELALMYYIVPLLVLQSTEMKEGIECEY